MSPINPLKYEAAMAQAISDYIAKHGQAPSCIMLGEDVWRERADDIAENMNRTGPESTVVVHRAKGDHGIHCCDFPEAIPAQFREDQPPAQEKPSPVDPFDL